VFANRVGVAALIVCYAVTRFVALTKLPIFIDEATFIHFAMRVWHGNPFEIVPFGKLLHVWLIALVIPWASSPLWAARAVTAFGDGLALYACLQIGTKLYDRPTGFLCAALYIICPFTLF